VLTQRERFLYRNRQGAGAHSAQGGVDVLQSSDQIDHLPSLVGPSRGPAKMGPAAKRPGFVNLAEPGLGIQDGTGSVTFEGDLGLSECAQGGCGDPRPPFGAVGCFPGQRKLSTLGAPDALPLHRPLFQFGVHRPDLGHGIGLGQQGLAGSRHGTSLTNPA